MNSGCICCSLVGDFGTSLKEVITTYHPDRIIIEPSGVGKLSDVIKAVKGVDVDCEISLNSYTTVADVNKCKMYMRNFGEFFENQLQYARTIILSRTDTPKATEEKVAKAVALIREVNKDAVIITLQSKNWTVHRFWKLWSRAEKKTKISARYAVDTTIMIITMTMSADMITTMSIIITTTMMSADVDMIMTMNIIIMTASADADMITIMNIIMTASADADMIMTMNIIIMTTSADADDDHDHEHHHDGECGCGHDHHHHHADEVFTSWGRETAKKYTKEEIEVALKTLSEAEDFGVILRAKGMVDGKDGQWIYFDMVPEEYEVRTGTPQITGKICVIGSKMAEDKIAEIFGVNE